MSGQCRYRTIVKAKNWAVTLKMMQMERRVCLRSALCNRSLIPNRAFLLILLRTTQACIWIQVLLQTAASVLVRHLVQWTAGCKDGLVPLPDHKLAKPVVFRVVRFLLIRALLASVAALAGARGVANIGAFAAVGILFNLVIFDIREFGVFDVDFIFTDVFGALAFFLVLSGRIPFYLATSAGRSSSLGLAAGDGGWRLTAWREDDILSGGECIWF